MENELVNVSQSSIAQALATDYFCIYYVNVDDDRFIEYSASPEYRQLGLPTMGDDLITFARTNFEEIIHPDDQERFLDCFVKENIIESLDYCGSFAMTFRMMFGDAPTYVYLKITRMIEEEAKHVVIGISSVDEQIKARIKEDGNHTVIDKISVKLNERTDQYEADFLFLGIKGIYVHPKYVRSYEKLLAGGFDTDEEDPVP